MRERDDPVAALSLEFEAAVLGALQAMRASDSEALKSAYMRFAEAVSGGETWSVEDWDRSGQILMERGHIPEEGWHSILYAGEKILAEQPPRR